MNKWTDPSQMKKLLAELIQIPSVTGSKEEAEYPYYVNQKLSELSYFNENPQHLAIHSMEDGRNFLTALVKSNKQSTETIILLSHFDVVETDCYGQWQELAYDMNGITKLIYEDKSILPDEVQKDIESGDWLFGRGVMDMKYGLALHMSMIEKASNGEFQGNILLLTVPDEEVGSLGMRAAVPTLVKLAEEHGLQYSLVLDAEPMYVPDQDDRFRYLEKGSIGKVLPGFLCYGKETHVIAPFEGLNGNYMAAEITRELELDTSFCEEVNGQRTPPPANLIQRSLMTAYSVTIPYRAVTMFNILLLEKKVEQLIDPLLEVAKRVGKRIEDRFVAMASNYNNAQDKEISGFKVNVLCYDQLLEEAIKTYGEGKVNAAIDEALRKLPTEADDREAAAATVDAIASICKHLTPLIVLFFAPPYYPPISSKENKMLSHVIEDLSHYAKDRYGYELKHHDYHGAMIDLAYVGMHGSKGSDQKLANNMPLWGTRYSIPFEAMENFIVPVMNVGPFGKDPHKWTERLESNYAFKVLPDLLSNCIRKVFAHAQ